MPIALNSLVALAVAGLTEVGRDTTRTWLAATPGAEVVDITNQGFSLVIHVRAPGTLPPTTTLMSDLSGRLPGGIPVVLERSVGESVDLGTTS
ncbi:hypothetical protein GCM10009868_00380 [Terrabacter aerolatus]|uniref:Uncharacterized protein n=1 Tax=Terrabacter aerolatus TaxID=422442 RepID=A0A512D343_9MICO|nr:hypothetical protein [Terrabacter aerolatus]GEO30874.1 hypothetical protein TAE01_26840 [Terrabacter aerolatus]